MQRICSILLVAHLSVGGCAHEPRCETSIGRAIVYLHRAVAEEWHPGIPAMVQYLARRFPSPALRRLAREARRPLGKAAVDETLFPPAFYRLIVADHVATLASIKTNPDPMGRVTARALHCDRLGLPGDYLATLEELATRGGYALTHAVLAARWTVENDCLTGQQVQLFQEGAIERLEAMVDLIGVNTDLGIEGVAILYYGHARSHVRPEWIEAIPGAQRRDGGWAAAPDVAASNPHTTYLALWVLLEDAFPHAVDVSMIPR